MISPVLPLVELHVAETTPGLDVLSFRLPQIHGWSHLDVVHQPQVLAQMVFPVECTRFETLLLTGGVIVSGKMVFTWLELAAVDTLALACRSIRNDLAQGRAYPFLERQVKTLLVPLPIILRLEAIGTERALEYTRCILLTIFRCSGWDASSSAPLFRF